MATSLNTVEVSFTDDSEKLVGTLAIVATKSDGDTLFVIDSREAEEYGEEPIQILEGNKYEYELVKVFHGLHVRDSEVVKRSKLSNKGLGEKGLIEPGLYTGMLPIFLEDSEGNIRGRLFIEVCSVKLNYRNEYRYMMEFITEKCNDLLLDIRSPSQARLMPDPGNDPETIGQRFAFLQSILLSREFTDSINAIIALPHHRTESEVCESDIRKGFRPNRDILRQIATRTPRSSVPNTHPLFTKMKAVGVDQPSIPNYLTINTNKVNIDTPENRFIKFVLNQFLEVLNAMLLRLKNRNLSSDRRLSRDITLLQKKLFEILDRDFFKELSDPEIIPLGSPILQQKYGYREILRAWLQFQMAARMVWEGGEDVFGGGKRDIAVLYEYWGFFQLLDAFTQELGLSYPPIDQIVEKTNEGFCLKLKSGKCLLIEGICQTDTRSLHVQFGYNRTFTRTGADPVVNYPQPGSWTRSMRPDYTLTFWPEEFALFEAEQQELVVHLHFDAKYRVESINDLFGQDSEEELEAEKISQRQGGTTKRVDLLKMHTYRDAIRRTEGAYVVYPGAVKQDWRGFHEIIPGLGAFPLRPGNEKKDLQEVRLFLREIINHLSNRASQSEQLSYHKYRIYNKKSNYQVKRRLPEKNEIGKREVSPNEHFVLLAVCETKDQMEWVENKHKYVSRLGKGDGSAILISQITGIKHLLIFTYGESGMGLWKVNPNGIAISTGEFLRELGYPLEYEQTGLYAVFEIAKDFEYDSVLWDASFVTKDKIDNKDVEIRTLSSIMDSDGSISILLYKEQ